MTTIYCSNCAAQISAEAVACPQCGQPNKNRPGGAGPKKSRITAGVLALLLGGLGVHKFYLGKVGLGIVYILFCWTFVPAIVAFVEAIIYFVQDDRTFAEKQGVNV